MIRTGKFLSARALSTVTNAEPKQETRTLKVSLLQLKAVKIYYYCIRRKLLKHHVIFAQFGELQVELTPDKAYIGAVIGFLFGQVILLMHVYFLLLDCVRSLDIHHLTSTFNVQHSFMDIKSRH